METRDGVERLAAGISPGRDSGRTTGASARPDARRHRHPAASPAAPAHRAASWRTYRHCRCRTASSAARRLPAPLQAPYRASARKPGIGDRVAKVFRLRQIAHQRLHHLLDQEIAEADAAQALLGVRDRIEDRRVGVRQIDPRRALVEQLVDVVGQAVRPAPPRRRSAAPPGCSDGRRRSSAGRNPAGS